MKTTKTTAKAVKKSGGKTWAVYAIELDGVRAPHLRLSVERIYRNVPGRFKGTFTSVRIFDTEISSSISAVRTSRERDEIARRSLVVEAGSIQRAMEKFNEILVAFAAQG